MPPNQASVPDSPEPTPRAPAPLITPRQRSNTALRRALRDLFDRWTALGRGVLADPDPELLHQFRVSLRRSRSLLREVRDVFDAKSTAGFRRDLKWLTAWTGPVRDHDVLGAKLPAYARKLDEQQREALAPIRRALAGRRRVARESLLAALESERYARLIDAWPRFLAKEPDPLGPLGRVTLIRAVEPAVGRVHTRLVKRRRKLGPGASDEQFHRARIDGKRLRYLLEQFSPLFPEEPAQALLRQLHKLQDLLGDFNDCRVHSAALGEILEALPRREAGRAAATRAVRSIRRRLDKKAVRHRERAVKRLAKVEAAGTGLFAA